MGEHIPVLLHETIESLNIRDGGTYVDLTLGRAGHSSEILRRIPHGHLIAFDQDDTALAESEPKLKLIGNNFTLIHSNFIHLREELAKLGIGKVDGIMADLGVSSPQLDDPSRGFTYRADAPLDMRMDQNNPLTAAKVVNTYSLEELTKVISTYGEDKDAYRIAKKIVEYRQEKAIETTFELVEIIKSAKSMKTLATKGHPAKQTFQALRIEVNKEEASLEELLKVGPSLLKEGGRLAIITFMSLDDRLVKDAFRALSTIEGDRESILLPEQIQTPDFELYSRKPIAPSEQELEENHRSASAKLRTLIRK